MRLDQVTHLVNPTTIDMAALVLLKEQAGRFEKAITKLVLEPHLED